MIKMQTNDVAQWKKELFARRRTHAIFLSLFVAANICYLASSVVGASVLILVGFVIEIVSWVALGTNDDRHDSPPDGIG